MKQPKKASRAQKELMTKNNMNPDNWMVMEEDKYQIVFINKRKSRRRVIHKEIRKG